jgi:hypothetical protein
MLITISYPGSHRHSMPGSTMDQAMVLLHGVGDMIPVTKF